ncbi:MAG: acyloxyacyl hydrolase [Pyrinomonadaceae bacterium]
MKKFILAAFCLLISMSAVCAQADETGKNELSVWGGFSPDSNTFIKAFGRTPDARFGIIAFRYARRFNNSDSINLKYTADVVPAAFLNYPDVEVLSTLPPSARLIRPTRYAFGVAPLGLQANFRPRKRVQPFLAASGGLLYFSQRTPNFVGTRFAFTADVGGGIEFKFRENRAVTVGYKYYHISNGDRGIENPGFDNNLFYIGYTFFSR